MKLRERIARLLFGGVIERAAQSAAMQQFGFVTGSRREIRPQSDAAALALAGYSYRCMQIRADALATTAWQVFAEPQPDKRRVYPSDHWAPDLLRNPNPYYLAYEIYSAICYSLDMTGDAFLWTPRNGGKIPAQIWPLLTERIRIVLDKNSIVRGYILHAGHEQFPIPSEDIVHLRNFVPHSQASMVQGFPLVRAAIANLRISAEQKRFIFNFFETDAVPPLVVQSDKSVGDDEYKRLKARWNEKMPNHLIAAILENGAKVMPVTAQAAGTPTAALTAEAGRPDTNARELCAAFGVPMSMLVGDFQNRATATVVQQNFYDMTVLPLVTVIGQALTKHLRRYDPAINVAADKRDFTDPEFEMNKRRTFGFVPNEIRAEAGLPPVEGGDAYLVPAGFVPINQLGESFVPPAPEQAAPGALSVKLSVKPSADEEARRVKLWKSYDGVRSSGEKSIRNAVVATFRDLEMEVLNNAGQKSIGKEAGAEFSIFDEQTWEKTLGDACTPALKKLLRDIGRQATQTVGENWDDIETDFERMIKKLLADNVAKIKGSVGTVKQNLTELLAKMDGKTQEEIAGAIRRQFNIFTQSRARAIARTTATNAASGAQKAVWKEFGLPAPRWLSQRDGNVRPDHIIADGQQADENGMFDVGGELMPHPCAGDIAENNVNCRCGLMP
jgi:HK97 family phage portal protein